MTATPAAELRAAAEQCRADAAEFGTAFPGALADLLEALSLDPDLEREHDGCDRTICASAAALAVARALGGAK